jgi:putative ABC transport system substrate-binding protein
LVRLDLDLIVAANTTYIPSLRQAGNAAPIVFCLSADPVAEGIVASLARPGGNMTGNGAFGPELGAKQLDILAQVVPNARRIAILWDPTYEQHKVAMPSIEAAAQELALTLQLVPARTADEFDAAFAAMESGARRIRGDACLVAYLQPSAALGCCARVPSAERGCWRWRPLELRA